MQIQFNIDLEICHLKFFELIISSFENVRILLGSAQQGVIDQIIELLTVIVETTGTETCGTYSYLSSSSLMMEESVTLMAEYTG